ncbi:putative D-arabinitol 2-dehydrogenase [Amylocarpus encephaloides]|uniref:D-arabinitol 2-dehydrogenase n=1 Tax=Amylocarpus encephaloides TaxID=45428 RepID=A0A9P7YSC9_9HELO|nr:putative D-arabinitol 2-dehydrogenase [Amylocarpus encephaloides]
MIGRTALRATRGIARATAGPSNVTRATFTAETKRRNIEVISEKEVPSVSFDGGEARQSILHVGEKTASDPSRVMPLTREAFNRMPATMQKGSIMGKVVIITGGARGLGNCMARACIEAGAKAMIIFDANPDLGVESAAELHEATNSKIPVEFFAIDVRDAAAIENAVKVVVEKYGAPDVLINSAGIADSNIPAEKYDHDMWRRLIDINLTGSFLISQAVGKAMMTANKPGSIVLVASMSGSVVNYPQEQSCYNASKAGVVQFGKSLGAEWAKYNIRVNCISPGYMDTALNNVPALDKQKAIWKSLTPQQRLGAVNDLNGLAVFLASDASAFMTGSNVIIDGGYSLY